ncbi:glycosyltransferase family 4 protein [Actinomadura flavalba]|uniref:glycosyltransferase family 4 protein n=1 Tax=Actinomadura flavalba TaxID=1120938 RepID=UPI00036E7C34|nr:glycosyltransferase family 4 protein [Actinomadura flavalba]
MRLTYVLTWAYAVGGTIRTVITQANAMAAAGHDVELVSVLRTRDEPHFPVDPRVRMVTLIDRRGGAAPDGAPGRLVPADEPRAGTYTAEVEETVARYLRGVTGGVLVTTRPALNLLAAEHAPARLVRVAQEHLNLGVHRPGTRAAILASYGRLDAVVTLTEGDRVAYEKALGGAVRIEQIPNALHTLDVPRADPSARTVVAAGRLTRQKGFDLLIPAFERVAARFPDWRLRIYGDGEQEARLRGLVRRRHLYNHVFLMGARSNLGAEMTKGSVFALSSRFEGFGMVLAEAMSHGLATVAFDCPEGPGEIITDGVDGVLVPARDVDALAASLCRVIADDQARRALGTAGLRTARRYDPDAIRARWEHLFADLAER